MMSGSKPSGPRRVRGTTPTFPSPSPQPSPSGRGSTGFGRSPRTARGMILPDWMTVSLSPRERVRVRGTCSLPIGRRRAIPGTVEFRESSTRAGGFPKCS